jgi:HD superfamily phosphodiesterase
MVTMLNGKYVDRESEGSAKIAVARRAEGLGVALSPNAASEEIAILLPHDILGRAATLEFREGLTRRDAEFQALAEFGGGQR